MHTGTRISFAVHSSKMGSGWLELSPPRHQPNYFLLAWTAIGTLSTFVLVSILVLGQGTLSHSKLGCNLQIVSNRAERLQQQQQQQQQHQQLSKHVLDRSTGFYVHPSEGRFNRLARESGTDKVTTQNYQVGYGKLFELPAGITKVKKMLEIGFGCTMNYGPGASAIVWRQMFPDAEIWFADNNATCVEQHKEAIKKLNIHVVTGDQQDVRTLHRWVQETGGGFDIIIDDGGHSNQMMYNSFMVLFQHALKPGGMYIIEDLHCARSNNYWCKNDQYPLILGGTAVSMIDVIKDWMDALLDPRTLERDSRLMYNPTHRIPSRLRAIDCAPQMCMFTKCYQDDQRCTYRNMEDQQLVNWQGQQRVQSVHGSSMPAT